MRSPRLALMNYKAELFNVSLLLLLLGFVAASSNIFPDYSTIDSCDSLIVSAVYTVVT